MPARAATTAPKDPCATLPGAGRRPASEDRHCLVVGATLAVVGAAVAPRRARFDALIARNTITFEHAMIAKGASPAEAKRLAHLKVQQDQAAAAPPQHYSIGTRTSPYQHNDDNHDDNHDDDNDAIIEEYRTKRLMQLQRGNVIPISRTEWSEEVNRASESQWVVILLTSASSAPNLNPYHKDQCLKVETDVVPHLAGKFGEVKWVSIPSRAAIENWPDENLPTLFCYRRGELQCQLVGLAEFGCIHADDLEYKLGKMGVLESNIEVDPRLECVILDGGERRILDHEHIVRLRRVALRRRVGRLIRLQDLH